VRFPCRSLSLTPGSASASAATSSTVAGKAQPVRRRRTCGAWWPRAA
jgi:hypothetical protein